MKVSRDEVFKRAYCSIVLELFECSSIQDADDVISILVDLESLIDGKSVYQPASEADRTDLRTVYKVLGGMDRIRKLADEFVMSVDLAKEIGVTSQEMGLFSHRFNGTGLIEVVKTGNRNAIRYVSDEVHPLALRKNWNTLFDGAVNVFQTWKIDRISVQGAVELLEGVFGQSPGGYSNAQIEDLSRRIDAARGL